MEKKNPYTFRKFLKGCFRRKKTIEADWEKERWRLVSDTDEKYLKVFSEQLLELGYLKGSIDVRQSICRDIFIFAIPYGIILILLFASH